MSFREHFSPRYLLCGLLSVVLLLGGLELVLRIRADHRPIGEEHGETFLIPSPTVYHMQRPLRPAGTVGAVTFPVNSFGLRGAEIETPKPPNRLRILCLGDELLLAPEVAEADTLCSHLTGKLSRRTTLDIEVINGGVVDSCPLLSYLQFRHHLAGIESDLVCLIVRTTDLDDDHRFRRYCHLDDANQPLACPHPDLAVGQKAPLDPTRHSLIAGWVKSRLLDRLGNDSGSSDQTGEPEVSSADLTTIARQSCEPIQLLARSLRSRQSQFLVLFVPDAAQNRNAAVRSQLESLKLPLIAFDPGETDLNASEMQQRIADRLAATIPRVFPGVWRSGREAERDFDSSPSVYR